LDHEYRILEFNPEAERFYGCGRADVLGKDYLELFLPDDAREAVAADIEKVLAGKPSRGFENVVMTNDKQKRILRWNVGRILDFEGRPAGVVAVGQDITERKKAEEDLRQSKEFLANMIDALDDPVFVKDQQHRWAILNDAACKVMGRSREELIGKSDYDLFSKQQVDVFWERDEFVLKSGRTDINEEEITWHGKLHTISTKKSLFTDSVTGKKFIVGTIRDITDHKNKEEEIRVFLSGIEGAYDGVAFAEMNGDVIYANEAAEKILGYSPTEMTKLNVAAFSAQSEDTKHLEEAIAKQGKWRGEITGIKKNREKFPAILSVSVVKDEKGKPIGRMGIFRDITERKRAEEALKTSELRFRSLIEQTTDAVFCYEYDPPIPTDLPIEEQVKLLYDGVLVECNDVCAKSYGALRAQEVIGRTLTELFGTTSGSLDKLFTELIQGGYHIVDGQGVEKLEDGTQRYYLNNGHGVIENGKLIRVWGTFRDITDRKKAEEALSASEERYRAIFEQAADAILLIDGETGTFVEFNDRAHQNLGYTCEEFRKLKIPDLEVIESAEEVAKHIEKIITEGADTFETKHRTKGGEIRDVQVSSRAISIHEKDFVQSIWRDITDHKKAEEALRESEEKFRLITSSAQDAIVMADGQGRISYWNPGAERIFGYGEEEVIGKNLARLMFPSRLLDEYSQRIKKFGMIGEDPFVEKTIGLIAQRKCGEEFPMELSLASLRIRDRWCSVGVIRDVSERHRAATELRESEERLKILFESAPDAIYLNDLKGNFVDGNKAAEEMVGYAKEELIGKNFAESGLLSPKQLLKAAANLAKNAMGRPTGPDEFTLKRKDGSCVAAEIRTFPVRIENQTLVLGIARDISERKRAQQSLEESESRFRELVENIREVFWMENAEGTELLYVSPAYEEIWGRFCEEFYRNPKVWIDAIHPDDRQRVAEAFSRFRETGVYSEEFRIVRPDGTIRWIWDRGVLIHNESGEVARVAGIAEDITQRKQAEDALKESEKRFRNLSEAAFEGISFNEKGVLVDANKAFTKIFGYSLEELKGKQIVELVAPEHRELVTENIRSGYEGIYEHRGLHKDGSLLDLEIHGRSVTYQGRKMRLTAIRDNTERKSVEEQVQEYQRRLRSLASELSLAEERQRHQIATELHDNTSQELAFALMKLQNIRETASGDSLESLDDVCEIMSKVVENIRNMTFDICSPTLYKFGLETAVSELLEDKLGERDEVSYSFSDDKKAKPLSEDIQVALFQSVRELVNNTIKHARAHNVAVDIQKCENTIRISVNDDGVGFKVDELESPERPRGGFGLFSIAERLKYIGGSFEFQSQPGRGSSFTLEAPLKTDSNL
jgi:PAS domain S-box-containing protein